MKPTTNKDANKGAATMPPKVDAKPGDEMLPYEDFEPFCGWRREEGQETLVVHVPEFKKDQLKVHISNRGTLRITGERPIGSMKRSCFTKEIKVPKDCNPNEITAKFTSAGLLHITMPKRTSKQDQPIQVALQQAPAQNLNEAQSQSQPQPQPQPQKEDHAQDQNEQLKAKGTQDQIPAEESTTESSGATPTMIRGRQVVMGVAQVVVVVAVMVALGGWAMYNYTRPKELDVCLIEI